MFFPVPLRQTLVSVALCAALPAFAAFAQEAAPQPALGEPFEAASYTDWRIMCTRIDEAGTTSCEMYQLLRDPTDQPIAEISIAALPLGAEFAAGATITTPLETFLPSGMGWRLGTAEDMRIEGFRVCTVIGCVVRMGFSVDEVDAMKAGSTATIMIAPFVAIDQPVEITVSLRGFTAAYNDLQTRLAEAAAAARN